ncbi:MAG: MotA/TolQ/ExbB proton channel family protein [Litorimonas sp.]
MKIFTKATVAALGAAVLFSTTPAAAQITSVNALFDKVRQDAAKTEQENRQRESEFRSRANEQESLLNSARGELATLERQAAQVESSFAANRRQIDTLSDELRAAQGDFGEVFGLARSKAGEFKALLDSSLITSQYPTRTAILGRVAESKALPSADDLNAVWQAMLQEIKAQRQVATYDAPVANVNDGATQSVTRVGPFAVFTAGSAEFLGYTPPSTEGESSILLAKLPKQPAGPIAAAAKKVTNGSGLVYAPIDPTRGELLKSFERVPSFKERHWVQGGPIGKGIIIMAFLGVIFGVLNIVRLFLVKSAVGGQKRKAQASKGNPLGRVMMAYDSAQNKDAETVELKLDEAILKESPKLEVGLNLLKLLAGIAPLLGLLGTVTGMIQTFQAMMIYGTGDPQLMAGGISVALVTTMLGLYAAIPLLILHSFCSSMARSVQGTLEEQSAGIVARHVETRGTSV